MHKVKSKHKKQRLARNEKARRRGGMEGRIDAEIRAKDPTKKGGPADWT